MKTLTIGENCEINSYYTKQSSYGRQSLYVELKRNDTHNQTGELYIGDLYVMDVFPNVLEHFQKDYYLTEYASYNEERGVYTRDDGDGEYSPDCIFDTTVELLNHALKGMGIDIEAE